MVHNCALRVHVQALTLPYLKVVARCSRSRQGNNVKSQNSRLPCEVDPLWAPLLDRQVHPKQQQTEPRTNRMEQLRKPQYANSLFTPFTENSFNAELQIFANCLNLVAQPRPLVSSSTPLLGTFPSFSVFTVIKEVGGEAENSIAIPLSEQVWTTSALFTCFEIHFHFQNPSKIFGANRKYPLGLDDADDEPAGVTCRSFSQVESTRTSSTRLWSRPEGFCTRYML